MINHFFGANYFELVEVMIVCRCMNRNFCNGRGKISRSRNNRLTFKKDRRGFLVSVASRLASLFVFFKPGLSRLA